VPAAAQTTPRKGVTSPKSRPMAKVMCWSPTRTLLVGSTSTKPKRGEKTDSQACEASAPTRRGLPGGGVVTR
jgi:hypothetical protein